MKLEPLRRSGLSALGSIPGSVPLGQSHTILRLAWLNPFFDSTAGDIIDTP